MSNSLIFALFALLAFGLVFKLVSLEERRNFFRTAVALLMVLGLVAYFVQPLVNNADLRQLLDTAAIVAFLLAVLFLLAYVKLDRLIRAQRQEEKRGPKRGGR